MDVSKSGGKRKGMIARSNHPIDKVRQLQRRLYVAAKCKQERRFHALYDRIWRSDVLLEAWKRVREKQGAAGIDGVTLKMIEQQGVAQFLAELQPLFVRGSIVRIPCGDATFPNQTASSGPWAFPP